MGGVQREWHNLRGIKVKLWQKKELTPASRWSVFQWMLNHAESEENKEKWVVLSSPVPLKCHFFPCCLSSGGLRVLGGLGVLPDRPGLRWMVVLLVPRWSLSFPHGSARESPQSLCDSHMFVVHLISLLFLHFLRKSSTTLYLFPGQSKSGHISFCYLCIHKEAKH